MKNLVSTVILFGFIFILILGGAWMFEKMNIMNSLKNVDQKINTDIHKVIKNGADNKSSKNATAENLFDKIGDNITEVVKDAEKVLNEVFDNETIKKGLDAAEELINNDNLSNTDTGK